PGMVLQFPDREHPPALAEFQKQPHIFNIFQEHKEWGRIQGIQTIGQLNEIIFNKKTDDFIKIAEAFHEKKIAHISDKIAEKRGRVKWVLLSGPSSAGKTTFAKRLRVQLRVHGLRPVTISVDDYFVNRSDTPKDADGNYDFEHVETIDLELLNQHLTQLDAGEPVELPHFNFETGTREFRGKTLQLEEDQMVIMEGIHCLNPRLTENIPDSHKYRVYISALTQLNLDNNNRLSTTDNRLLRRMVRDNQFRGNNALATLKMWPSVRRGEKLWIFPFQKHADIAFNSALDYEWAVLRPLAEPLLAEIKPHHDQYAEARRVMQFLDMLLEIPRELVPGNSLLREFIGESSFKY
ncbi:MAG: nucleoside kinase, partial [Verrucomicrobiota bacterium]